MFCVYFDTLARPNSSSLISCCETGILSNLIVGTCLSDSSSKYLIRSLTNARAANRVREGILLGCLAGRFIDCSIFSAASCTNDFGLVDKLPCGLVSL